MKLSILLDVTADWRRRILGPLSIRVGKSTAQIIVPYARFALYFPVQQSEGARQPPALEDAVDLGPSLPLLVCWLFLMQAQG
jgi:hypothetical protein